MTVIIIIFIAIIIGFVIKSIHDAKKAAKERAKERAERRIAKEKMRNNKILQMSVACIVEHLQKNINSAKNVTLDNKTEDFYVAKICTDGMCCYEGLMRESPYRVNYENQREYYFNWFDHCLDCVSHTCYYDEGYSNLNLNEMKFFQEVLLEELKKHGCPTCNVYLDTKDRDYGEITEYSYYLIWDITPYHPKKELNSFL